MSRNKSHTFKLRSRGFLVVLSYNRMSDIYTCMDAYVRLCFLCRLDSGKDVGWSVTYVYLGLTPGGVCQLV